MKRPAGFTLIEVMMVVIIIGILAAIAVPNYSDYLTRSRITQATSGLAERRVRMEQFFQDNHTYVAAPPCAADNSGNYFNFSATCPAAGEAEVYLLTATGKSSMTGFVYTLNQANARTTTIDAATAPAGWGTAEVNCWVTSKGGGC
ncbi:MAG: type IV pilin protein [Candidatus Accumulibacter sp. UW26]